MVEMHGNLFRTRCSRCTRPPFEDATVYPDGTVPTCDVCGGFLRPDIVWFGERIATDDMARIEAFVSQATTSGPLTFVAAGTSGVVYPAAGMVNAVRARGADTWLVNAEPANNASQFVHFVEGKSGEVLPVLLGGRGSR